MNQTRNTKAVICRRCKWQTQRLREAESGQFGACNVCGGHMVPMTAFSDRKCAKAKADLRQMGLES